ncbi:hypothetical protein CDCA_CDCA08G2354 [Cyanidium caldarium]|uniref:Brix domain-containing protein n=1 Tax=Cyanidium caldarium TaxID=2771 RepID=A0AAV9IW20_CYACA|nr:hypothetical protein CDCA_CDCA08G2354 [Cyanidium caldarium]
MPKRNGGRRRKRRTHVPVDTGADENDATPRSLVFRRGRVSHAVRLLVHDLRSMLRPHTAVQLRERPQAELRDYVAVSSHLGASHFVILSEGELGLANLRLARAPRGPTATFRVREFSLVADVQRVQRRPVPLDAALLRYPPLMILSGFDSSGKHVQMIATLLQTLFPGIDVRRTDPDRQVRRAVFVDWDTAEDGENVLHVRHYAIRKRPVGLSRAVRRMVQRAGKRHGVLPLGQLEDVSQVLDAETMAGVITSESEAEPPADCQVDRWDATPADESIVRHGETAPPRSRSTPAKERQAIRLVELGPRLTLQLVKVEAGMCRGEVLYHASAHRNRPEGESSGKRAATGERYRAPKVPRRVTWQEEVRVADSPALDSSGDERSPAESDA